MNFIVSIFDVVVGYYRDKPMELVAVIVTVIVLAVFAGIPFWAALLFGVGVSAIFANASSRFDR